MILSYIEAMDKLKIWLQQRDESAAAFGRRVGIDRDTMSKFLRGKAKPSLETAVKIEDVTGGEVPPREWIKRDARKEETSFETQADQEA